MLHNLSEEIRKYYEHAAECARQAEAVADAELRADFLRLEKGWLKLARSYELGPRLRSFSSETARRRNERNERTRTVDETEPREGNWKPANSAPFDRELQLAIIDSSGVHSLIFPCRRILHGWINARTKKSIDLCPTHWREWRGPILEPEAAVPNTLR